MDFYSLIAMLKGNKPKDNAPYTNVPNEAEVNGFTTIFQVRRYNGTNSDKIIYRCSRSELISIAKMALALAEKKDSTTPEDREMDMIIRTAKPYLNIHKGTIK